MNADGSAGIEVEADLQAEVPHLGDVAVGLLVAGALGALTGGLLLWRSLRRRPQVA